MRNSPPTHQISDVMAPAGFTTHSMQVMHWTHAAPRCPSTQPAAGAKSPCGRLLASERMSDGHVGAGRAGFVAQTLRRGCVRHGTCQCSRSFVRFQRANVPAQRAAQSRARNSVADEPASRHAFGQRIHTSIPNSSLAPRRRTATRTATRHLPINIHGHPLAHARVANDTTL